MANVNILSDELVVKWDEAMDSLLIVHPDTNVPGPIVRIRASTLADMSFQEASTFIGERLALLMPALRARYINPVTGRVEGASDA
jgi:hypothetical protein